MLNQLNRMRVWRDLPDRQTDRQTRPTDRQTDRQTDKQTDRQTDALGEAGMSENNTPSFGSESDRQTGRQTDRQARTDRTEQKQNRKQTNGWL